MKGRRKQPHRNGDVVVDRLFPAAFGRCAARQIVVRPGMARFTSPRSIALGLLTAAAFLAAGLLFDSVDLESLLAVGNTLLLLVVLVNLDRMRAALSLSAQLALVSRERELADAVRRLVDAAVAVPKNPGVRPRLASLSAHAPRDGVSTRFSHRPGWAPSGRVRRQTDKGQAAGDACRRVHISWL